jgi:hypothetical protein
VDHASALQELFAKAPEPQQRETSPNEGQFETHSEASTRLDDRARLQELFGVHPPADPASARSVRTAPEDQWPVHNYNEAYEAINQRRRIPQHRRPRDNATLWDIAELLEEPRPAVRPPPKEEPAAQVPWPEPKGIHRAPPKGDASLGGNTLHDPARGAAHWTPDGWLQALSAEATPATRTEARLVGTLRGDTEVIRRPLFDTTETLRSRQATTAGSAAPKSSPTTTTTTTATSPAMKIPWQARFPRARRLFLRVAGIALGLKIGVTAGFLMAALL